MRTLSSKKVTTKLIHRCWGCTELIPARSEVIVTTHTDNEKIYSCTWCEICYDFMATLDSSILEDGFGYGELCYCEGYPKSNWVTNTSSNQI